MHLPKVIPGRTTVKNLLSTALRPAGRTLYVYGGGWNYQDTGAGPQSTTLGYSPSWAYFFRQQDTNYDYRNFRGKGCNPYYDSGLDCSGYLGWVIYNTLRCQNGRKGFVFPARHFALTLAQLQLGIHLDTARPLRSGDFFSMKGHVWLCVGHCEDDSIVILHSTPSPSTLEMPGGGVQLSAIGPDEHCQAACLARTYMTCLSPEWLRRYSIMVYSHDQYTSVTSSGGGSFLWSNVLSDPEQLRTKPAQIILSQLFS